MPATKHAPIGETDALVELQRSTRSFFERTLPLTKVRSLGQTASGYDEAQWHRAGYELGFAALVIPPSLDGFGASLRELAVVAEEAGRALCSGPFFSTVCTATPLLLELAASPARDECLRAIAGDGRRVTIALSATDDVVSFADAGAVTATRDGETWRLDGTVDLVPDAGTADQLIVAALVNGSPALFLASVPDTELTDLESVDFTRRVARLLLTRTPAKALAVDDADLAARLERAADVVRTMVAAEQVGGAARCLEELVAYLTGRIQFDRPIASFQSVKHDCADLLADVTAARAAVAEASRRLATRDPGAGHYAALAKTTAGLAYLAVSDRSIQLHGGIGFTWECDAHLYYRRAIYTQSIFGDPAAMRRRLADDLDLSGRNSGRRHQAWAAARHPEAGTTADTFAVTSDYDTVRAEATQWLRDNWDPAMPTREWWRRLAEAGWSLPQWPAEWSGRDLPGPLLPAVHDAFAEVGALWPPWSPGQHLAGPTVIHHGTQQQKQLLLPALATGEHFWAQLFSEPGAGSDLASLRTRAVKQPDGGWIVNGQKVWTTGATKAERGFLLARTDPAAPKHRGLSYFVIDMDTPGLEARPIRQINGNSEFCEVFLTDVYIPPDRLIGEENGGWAVSLTSLGFERMAAPPVRVPAGAFGGMLDLPAGEALRRATSGYRDLMDFQDAYALFRDAYRARSGPVDPVFEDELVHLYIDVELDKLVGGMVSPGPGMTAASTGSISKLVSGRLADRLRAMAWRASGGRSMLGGDDAAAGGAITFMALTSFTENIAGGTEQIQRNIIAERVLGMPKEPRPGPK